jgi:sec-independent protein translocase protein TatA
VPEVGISGLIVILVVALLVFGPKRLPEIGRSVGKGLREFKDSVSGSQPSEAAAEPDSLEASKEDTGSSAAIRSESRFCTACGAPAGSEDRFCARCGASLEDAPQALTR